MMRLTIIGIIACVGLFFTTAAECGKTPPPIELDVIVQNTPLPVEIQNDLLQVEIPTPLDVNVLSAPPAVSASTHYQFAGYTGSQAKGTAGIKDMNLICQTEFKDGDARMASTEEFWNSSDAYLPDTGAAWIKPVLVSILYIYDKAGDAYLFGLDVTGAMLPNFDEGEGTCMQWSPDGLSAYGTAVGVNGRINEHVCSANFFIACSVPATP